jgi:hypothetical protein
MSGDQIHFFLHLRDQIKLYHWQTRVYSRHIATDQILEKIESSAVKFDIPFIIIEYADTVLLNNKIAERLKKFKYL